MRPPEVFVRPLVHGEAVALKRRSKTAKHFSTRERASILLASNTAMSAPEIASMWQTDESHVRKVIHEFNERGLDSLDPPPVDRRAAGAGRGGRRCPPRHAGGAADALVAAAPVGPSARGGDRDLDRRCRAVQLGQ